MIPLKYLSNIGVYEVEFQGSKVKASMIDNAAILDAKISELRTCVFQRNRIPVVGVDVNCVDFYLELLVLCGWSHCLIIQLHKFKSPPDCLVDFLADEAICFVGNGICDKVGCSSSFELRDIKVHTSVYGGRDFLSLNNVVEVGVLAARVLKKLYLSKCAISELASEVIGVDYVVTTSSNIGVYTLDKKAIAFTYEEIKCAIEEAYTCCEIGNKMLSKVSVA